MDKFKVGDIIKYNEKSHSIILKIEGVGENSYSIKHINNSFNPHIVGKTIGYPKLSVQKYSKIGENELTELAEILYLNKGK